MNELNGFKWSALIVDEFHKLKNEDSLISQSFCVFKTRTRIGLSGTVLQNNLMELWALLEWYEVTLIILIPYWISITFVWVVRRANPKCLGTKEHFKEFYLKPIVQGQRQNATGKELCLKVERSKLLQDLKVKWLLRRTKATIADQLPKKSFFFSIFILLFQWIKFIFISSWSNCLLQ